MYQRILVPVDGSPASERGLQEAMRVAKETGGRLLLVHVVDDMSVMLGGPSLATVADEVFVQLRAAGAQILADAERRAREADVPVETRLFENLDMSLCAHVVALAAEWKADLIVIGTHGRRGVRRLVLGSDAEQIVRTATVPVLLVRAPEAKRSA